MAHRPHLAAPPSSPPASKAARLRAMLLSADLEFLMEAHDGISAKIVEEAGFRGVWASGLSMSAALGVRDNNEASWTQVLEQLEFMADATQVPILVDGDTGWGNFNNLRRAVRKLCQRGIAGVCIEDKLFPKTNSFIGENQPLADIDEFCGKIKAGKDSQTDPDFCLVARVEALISGWGLDEALKRAEAYRAAGADAILMHSKRHDPSEILAFMREWNDRAPVVIVPTTYYATPTDIFRQAGVSTIIWANHSLRAAVNAMRDVCRRIWRDQSLVGVEDEIASVKDIFALAGNQELAEAEKLYLPASPAAPGAIVLAASRGAALGALTADRPKCMIDVRGQPILKRLVGTLRQAGVREVTVVRGYRKEMINLPSIATVDNDLYGSTGEAASLACALPQLKGACVVAYGDILFRRHLLDALLEADGDIVITADALWRNRGTDDPDVRDFVQCTQAFSPGFLDDEPIHLVRMANRMAEADVHGEWIGLAKLSGLGAKLVTDEIGRMRADGALPKASLLALFTRLVERGEPVRVLYCTGQWMDVDNAADLKRAGAFL